MMIVAHIITIMVITHDNDNNHDMNTVLTLSTSTNRINHITKTNDNSAPPAKRGLSAASPSSLDCTPRAQAAGPQI